MFEAARTLAQCRKKKGVTVHDKEGNTVGSDLLKAEAIKEYFIFEKDQEAGAQWQIEHEQLLEAWDAYTMNLLLNLNAIDQGFI